MHTLADLIYVTIRFKKKKIKIAILKCEED